MKAQSVNDTRPDNPGRKEQSRGRKLRPWLPAAMAAGLAVMVAVIAGSLYERTLVQKERLVAETLLATKGHALSAAVDRRFALLEGLQSFASATPSQPDLGRRFEIFASGLHAGATDIRNLALAPDGVIRYVYPKKGNEQAIGHDLLTDPQTREDALRAGRERRVTLSDPYLLRQGGLGLVAREPVFANGRLWGLATMVVDIPAVLAEAGLDRQAAFPVAVRDRAGRVFFGDPAVFAGKPVVMRIRLPEGWWDLAAAPKGGWGAPSRGEIVIFHAAAFLATLLVALIIFLIYDKQRRLAGAVETSGAALHESESYNRTLFELSPTGLALCSMDGVLIDVNPAFAAIIGRSVAETVGLSYWDITPERYAEQERLQLASLHNFGCYGPYEKEFLDKEGHPVSVRLQGRIMERNRERFIWSSVEDISERKRLEETVKERNRQLSLFAEHSPAAIAMFDREMNYLIVSRRWVEDYHLGDRQIIGRSHYEVFPEIPERWKEIHRRCLAGAVERADEEAFARADGSVNWIRWEIHPWYARTGEIGGIIIFSEDITERKRAESALRREYGFSEALIDSLPGVVYLYDQELKFIRWNKNFERVLGYSAEEIAGLSPLDFFAGDDKELVAGRIGEVFSAGASSVEADFVAKDGSRTPYFFTGVRTEIDDRVCLIGIGIDISARKKLEEELTSLNLNLEARVAERTRELQESRLALLNLVEDLNEKSAELVAANEKLKGIDRLKSMFIATMSHELRTPLNSVIGYSSIIMNGWLGPINTEQKEHLAIVLRAAKHLLSLINEVLDISKIEAGQVEEHAEKFDLHDVVVEACQQLQADIAAKGLALEVANAHVQLETDRRRLLQAILNLVSNAMKYTVQGSIRLAVGVSGPWAEIAVSDTGIGIGEEDAMMIFRPFMRLDTRLRNAVPGTGLGLYLTKKLVDDVLKGTISFTSRAGEGSTFTIRVPIGAAGDPDREETS